MDDTQVKEMAEGIVEKLLEAMGASNSDSLAVKQFAERKVEEAIREIKRALDQAGNK
ncbi:hypothetical protein ES702_03476 [subsurface metagenome]